MNQRRGRTHRAAMIGSESITTRELINFFEQASTEVDDSFYFEQIVDYLRNQYSPKKGLETPSKVFGL